MVVPMVVWALRLDVEWCSASVLCGRGVRASTSIPSIHEHDSPLCPALTFSPSPGCEPARMVLSPQATSESILAGIVQPRPPKLASAAPPQRSWNFSTRFGAGAGPLLTVCLQPARVVAAKLQLPENPPTTHHPPPPPYGPWMALAPWSPWPVANYCAHCTRPQKGSVEHEGPGS